MRQPVVAQLAEREGLAAVTDAARQAIGQLREEISAGRLEGKRLDAAVGNIGDAIARQVQLALTPSLRPLINATGVVLHTNMGRAPLSESALAHVQEVSRQYSNLEFDIATGERGKRDVHTQRLFSLVMANMNAPYQPHTIVVNNCAAAVLVALNSLAEGGEVIVSRGELVEIGGSFRVPEVMAKSQAVLREVGTTNRTRIADYEKAITEKTKLLLRVHRSNFAIVGFTEQPTLEELTELGRKHHVPVMEDLGNGALVDLGSFHVNPGAASEPGLADSLRAGVDVVTYSGDKLLGGPQAGLITGRQELVGRIRSNPLFRALRVDKLNHAALEATLLSYARGRHDEIPALRMMRLSAEEILGRAKKLAQAAQGRLRAEVKAGESLIGGGTAPTAGLPTYLVALSHEQMGAEQLQTALRGSTMPIIARVEEGRVLLDLRTVFPEQDEKVAQALRALSR